MKNVASPLPTVESAFEPTAYRVLGRLGAGGMGEVFLVEHRETGRKCVAKLLHARLAEDARFVDRTRLEAQSLGRLNHPHIVSVLGAGTTADARPFVILELLNGRTLKEELAARGGSIPVAEALTYACQVLSALSAAHGIGVVHRDIKPDNVFLCDQLDGSRRVKVLDFGVAKVLPGASPVAPSPLSLPTDEGTVVGTPRFMSPEGARGLPVDERADVYAVALVLYEMLTGRGPFDGAGKADYLTAHASSDPAPPSQHASHAIPPELDAAILRALAKDPGLRFSSAEHFKVALDGMRASLADCENAVPASRPVPSDSPHGSASENAALRHRSTSGTRTLALIFVVTLAVAALAGAAVAAFL